MKILCLFVRHGTEQYPEALTVLDQWYERHGLMGQRTLWIIDNALIANCPPKVLTPSTLLRPGDNRAWEFSAWAHAIHEASGEQIEYDVIHFVTSAFNTLYTAYLDHFSAGMLSCIAGRNICLGHIDSYDRAIQLGGHSSQSWIRTCFFFLPYSVVREVETWCAFTDTAVFFCSPASTQFRDDAPLSADYRHRIQIWLEGQDVGGHTWHSPIRPGQNEAERFQKKTLAILNEHNFSINLRKMRIPLVDFCWLSSLRKEADLRQIALPDGMAQIAVRRRILGITS